MPLLAVATAVGFVPAAAHAASAGGGVHELAPDGTPVEMRSVALGQIDRELVLTVSMRRPIDPAAFDEGGHICAGMTQEADEVTLCIERVEGVWRLRQGGKTIVGRAGLLRAGTLRVRWRPEDAGLAAGPVSWRVTVTPDDCVTQPDACRSHAPRAAEERYPGRVYRAVVIGCTPRGRAEVHGGPRGKRIALTYDDGPSAYTPAFLDTLRRLRVPATFFMVGELVSGRATLVRRMLADGHELGNHSWNHANLGGGGPEASSQLTRTNAAIRKATGYTPCVFRPPYGSTGADLVARTRKAGMTSIIWTVDPVDWSLPGASSIVGRVLSQTGPGAIILEHDGGGSRTQTLAAAPEIISALRQRGYTFVTVSQLLGNRERLALRR